MRPAFRTTTQTFVFLALLAAALALPALLARVGLPSRAEVYKSMPAEFASAEYLTQQIFAEKSQIDALFFGSSLLRAAINENIVRQAMEQRFLRPAVVRRFGAVWVGMDVQYFMLRDLLDRRKVRVLYLTLPARIHTSDAPHVMMNRFLRYGDYPEDVAALPARMRVRLFAGEVVAAPRHLLTLFRPNLVAADEHRPEQAIGTQVGYYGAPFVPARRTPPALSAAQMTCSRPPCGWFRFDGPEMGPYQMHWIRAIAALAARRGVHVVFVSPPLDLDRASAVVREREFWPEAAGFDASEVIGVPSATLFAGATDEEFYRFYADQHFNANGQRLFTETLLPAILELQQRYAPEAK